MSETGATTPAVDITVPTRPSMHLGSRFLKALCWAAGFVTIGVLLLIIAYILVNGLPEFFSRDEQGTLHFKASLFALKYNSRNLSMLPAILNTLTMTALSLLISVPIGVGGGIYCFNASPTIVNNTIAGNTVASSNGMGAGGGIYCRNASPIIS